MDSGGRSDPQAATGGRVDRAAALLDAICEGGADPVRRRVVGPSPESTKPMSTLGKRDSVPREPTCTRDGLSLPQYVGVHLHQHLAANTPANQLDSKPYMKTGVRQPRSFEAYRRSVAPIVAQRIKLERPDTCFPITQVPPDQTLQAVPATLVL
jgi:hypothetical protein